MESATRRKARVRVVKNFDYAPCTSLPGLTATLFAGDEYDAEILPDGRAYIKTRAVTTTLPPGTWEEVCPTSS